MDFIKEGYYKWIWAVIFVIAAVLSFTLIHDVYLNWGFTKYAVTYLDQKAGTVLALTGASTSASVAITLIPGDVGTPIASQLANISSYSIVVLAAVYLEKYLITMAALLVLKFLFPLSMFGAAVNVAFLENPAVTSLIKKICTFAAAVILVIPTSVYLSTLIENTYKDDVSVSIEQVKQDAEEIKANAQEGDQNIWNQFLSTVQGGTVELMNKFESSLNNFVEAISVMLITACAIPLLTFMVLFWLVKAVLQIDLKPPSLRTIACRAKIDPLMITEKKNDRS